MDFIKITEQESNHKDLEKKSVIELVNAMHQEDKNALNAVNKVLPRVSEVIEAIAPKIKKGIEALLPPYLQHMMCEM